MNSVNIIGNLGADPESRFLPSGTMVTNFNLAVTEKWVGADGKTQEETVWVSVACWGKLAEAVANNVTKGQRVAVTGQLKPARAYINRNNEPVAVTQVKAQTVDFLTPRGTPQQQEQQPAATIRDEDIPF